MIVNNDDINSDDNSNNSVNNKGNNSTNNKEATTIDSKKVRCKWVFESS